MSGTRYDVIVAGGGPAGGTTAYDLARRGARVLLLEKERLPRYKACAGGITLKTTKLLDFDLSPAYEQEIIRGTCTYRGGSPVTVDFGGPVGWTVMRDKLDQLIVRQAARVGTEVLDDQMVTGADFLSDGVSVSTTRGSYSCSILVGADGANGVVAHCAGLMRRRFLAVAVEAEVPTSGEALESRQGRVHFDFGSVPRGYGWVFPKKHVLSVGVGTFWGKASKLKAFLSRWLEALGLPSDPREVRMRGHLVPLGGVARVLHGPRVLLTGDAAGLAEPMTGEGIYYAVRSAKIAAETIYQALQNDQEDLSTYTERIDAEITRDLKYAKRMAALLYRFPRLCFHFFVRSPKVQRGVVDVLCGRSTFERLQHQLRAAAPEILLSGVTPRRTPRPSSASKGQQAPVAGPGDAMET
jgi:geranylgeranyl reductase family protein